MPTFKLTDGFLDLFRSKSKDARVSAEAIPTSVVTTMSIAPIHLDGLTAEQVACAFQTRSPLPDDAIVSSSLVGRFQRGTDENTLSVLSDEPGRKLSWVFGADTLKEIAGKSHAQAMLSVGFSKTWLLSRLHDGTQHRLVIFHCHDHERVLGTWKNIIELVGVHYSPAIRDKLIPHLHSLRTTHYKDIDKDGRLRYIHELPLEDKYKHSEFYSPEKILKMNDISLYDARGFLYHTIGCNYLFMGKGYSRDPNNKDKLEYLVPNRPIKALTMHTTVDVHVNAKDLLNEHEGKILSNVQRCKKIRDLFLAQEQIFADSTLAQGIVGRFVRGRVEDDFRMLSDDPANRVSFVFGGDTIKAFCGKKASMALISLGFSKQDLIDYEKNKIKHKLVLFPEPRVCKKATWDHVFELVRDFYGQDIYDKLKSHKEDLKLKDYNGIDPEGTLGKVSSLPREMKRNHPDFYSPERIRSLNQVNLFQARGFFYHSVRCNALFEGKGYTRARNGDEDRAEYLVENCEIATMEEAVMFDVEFDAKELVEKTKI